MTLGVLIIRVIAGLTMAAHGSQKLFGWFDGPGRRGTAGMMEKLGFREPAVMASLAGLAEFAGGLGLALGFLTPLAAIAIVVVMLNAALTVHLKNGFWNTAGGYEYPLVMSAIAVGIAATGPGRRVGRQRARLHGRALRRRLGGGRGRRRAGRLDAHDDHRPPSRAAAGPPGALERGLMVDRHCGGDRRRRPDRDDAGGRAGAGGDRRRHRRAARQPGARRLARRRSALAHHRGARPARHRRSVPRGGAGDADPGVRRDPAGHQRLPHPPQLRARAAGRATSSASWPAGSTSSGCRSTANAR